MQPTQQQEPMAMELESQTHLKQEQQELNQSLCDELSQPHQNHCEELHQHHQQQQQQQQQPNHQQQQRQLRSRSKQRRQQCEEWQPKPKKLRAHKMFSPCEHEMVVWEHLKQAEKERDLSIEAHKR
jgi:hypothetical protein